MATYYDIVYCLCNTKQRVSDIFILNSTMFQQVLNNQDWKILNKTQLDKTVSYEKFINSINVWNKNPHLIHKKIFGSYYVELGYLSIEIFNKLWQELQSNFTSVSIRSSIKNIIYKYKNESCEENNGIFTSVKLYTPKPVVDRIDIVEIIIIDNLSVTFLKPIIIKDDSNLTPNISGYRFTYQQYELKLEITNDDDETNDDAVNWLKAVLFQKIINWCKHESTISVTSLSLIDDNYKYFRLYSTLKEKYGDYICKMWPEVTDPQKYVFEDISIATYLILIWNGKQRFIDVGCGNGLLVFLLNSEQHDGYGIDVRARKIWSKYPGQIKLKEETLDLANEIKFSNVDWIIGNHTDELTPWIPVIAARSSCNFFLLPCCSYEFNGRKYKRQDSTKSQYLDYLEYVKRIIVTCGFNFKLDRLRIPSTKRTCFVCKNESTTDYKNRMISIDEFISNKNRNNECKLRNRIEPVRNCTKLSKTILENIVTLVFQELISDYENCVDNLSWYEGKSIHLSELSRKIPFQLLVQLKKEHGGLQTLLKNHSNIFSVKSGVVKIRKPAIRLAKPNVWKIKNCWFYENHPNSCPLEETDCSYLHEKIVT